MSNIIKGHLHRYTLIIIMILFTSLTNDKHSMGDEDLIPMKYQKATLDNGLSIILVEARNQIETGHIFGLQTNFVRGIRIGFSLTMTGDPLRFIKDLDKYRSTTADDIKRVAKKYFTPENRTVVRLLPKEESQDKSAR